MQQPLRRHHLSLSLSLLALGLGAGAAAHAEDGPAWSLSGFGTVGMVHSNERNADYPSPVLKPRGAGAASAWSADVDSRLGAQLDLTLDRRWSAVLQVVAEQGLDNSYRPRIEWANVKYQATPELALRLGRIALPMFLAADYRKIGYAYPWARPPVETYGSVPLTSSDGIDATWRWSAGQVRNASQFFFGRYDTTLVAPLRLSARRIVGVSNTSDWGALNLRVNTLNAELTSRIAGDLFDGAAAFGPAGRALGQRYAIDHKRVTVASVGLNYDPGQWFAMAEASRTRTESLLGSTRNLYASAGYRLGAFTPYATWARVRAAGATTAPGLPLAGVPAPYQPQAAMVNAALNGLLATIPQQSSASAGLRWDFRQNAALKLQLDRVTPHDGSRGTLINTTPAFRSGRTATVASVSIDFVY